jgi:hypothetical protein
MLKIIGFVDENFIADAAFYEVVVMLQRKQIRTY